MKHKDKEILFEKFLNEWGMKFNQIPFVLDYISSYPELTMRLNEFKPLSAKELRASQLEWIALISQLDNQIEREFFKPYWIPIQVDSYDYFIDLSSESLPIFETHYIFFEPYKWCRRYKFKKITDFLLSTDDLSIDLEEHLIVNDKESWKEIESFFREREKIEGSNVT